MYGKPASMQLTVAPLRDMVGRVVSLTTTTRLTVSASLPERSWQLYWMGYLPGMRMFTTSPETSTAWESSPSTQSLQRAPESVYSRSRLASGVMLGVPWMVILGSSGSTTVKVRVASPVLPHLSEQE